MTELSYSASPPFRAKGLLHDHLRERQVEASAARFAVVARAQRASLGGHERLGQRDEFTEGARPMPNPSDPAPR